MKGFEDLKKEVIDTDLCTRCGTCIGVCPTQTLAYHKNGIVDTKKQCIKCGKCSAVCPGKEFPMNWWAEALFQKPYDVNKLLGTYKAIWNACSKSVEVRSGGASGGVVTQLLIDLLKENVIEGAVSLRKKKGTVCEFEPFVAVNEEQIASASQSKYTIIPTNQIIYNLKQSGKRVAFVGLPCQVQGMRKAMENDLWLKEHIVILISLFCGFNMESEATDYLIAQSRIEKSEIERLSYRQKKGRDTGFYIRSKDGREFFVNKHGYTFLNLIYSPKRCWKCFDYSGEFSDISVGDAWEKGQGWSRVIVRTEKGEKAFEKVKNMGTICSESCDESRIIPTQKSVIEYKKKQIAIRAKRMKTFPDYEIKFEQCGGKLWIKGMLIYMALAFFKTPIGKGIRRFLPFKWLIKISEGIKGREVIHGESR